MAITIAQVKSSRLSDDRKEVVLVGKGRYIGEIEVSVAIECLDDLISALARAKTELGPPAAPPMATPSMATPSPRVPQTLARNGGADPNPDQVRCEMPKNCTVADARGLVLFILNHRLENERGSALPPDAAKALGTRLVKSADAVLAQGPAQPRVARPAS